MDFAHRILDVPGIVHPDLAAVQVGTKVEDLHARLTELQDALGRRPLQWQADRDDQLGIRRLRLGGQGRHLRAILELDHAHLGQQRLDSRQPLATDQRNQVRQLRGWRPGHVGDTSKRQGLQLRRRRQSGTRKLLTSDLPCRNVEDEREGQVD